jgi:hypothetical protein
MGFLTWAAALAAGLPVLAQQKPPAKIDQARIDRAIERGVESLKARGGGGNARELVLLAMAHAGLRTDDADFDAHFRAMLAGTLQRTYNVALEAMVLEEVDRVRHQKRIFRCAQFLVDNQCPNGTWSYGTPTTYPEPVVKDMATGGPGPRPGEVVIFGDPAPGEKPPVRQKLSVRKQRDAERASGDNSNSQYASLGLRACHDAGILLPREVVEKAAAWYRQSQCGDGGWSYHQGGQGYGSMTAGAVGALSILDLILGKNWKTDGDVTRGLDWLRDHFSVTENPGRQNTWHYYYLYGLERAGMLYGTEKLGAREWYAEGARYLLDAQAANGSWNNPIDTCFAILFLRRATRSLVESRDSK